jgi:hypothetical protein
VLRVDFAEERKDRRDVRGRGISTVLERNRKVVLVSRNYLRNHRQTMDSTESFEVKMLKTWKRGVSRALSALLCKPSPGILPLDNKHCRVQLGVPFYSNRGRGNCNTTEREIIYLL